jgi:hypothetical protein
MKQAILALTIIGNLSINAVDTPTNALSFKKTNDGKYSTLSNFQPTQEHRKEFGITAGSLMTILGAINLDKTIDSGYHLTPVNQGPCYSVQFNALPLLVTAIGIALVYDAMTLEDDNNTDQKKTKQNH